MVSGHGSVKNRVKLFETISGSISADDSTSNSKRPVVSPGVPIQTIHEDTTHMVSNDTALSSNYGSMNGYGYQETEPRFSTPERRNDIPSVSLASRRSTTPRKNDMIQTSLPTTNSPYSSINNEYLPNSQYSDIRSSSTGRSRVLPNQKVSNGYPTISYNFGHNVQGNSYQASPYKSSEINQGPLNPNLRSLEAKEGDSTNRRYQRSAHQFRHTAVIQNGLPTPRNMTPTQKRNVASPSSSDQHEFTANEGSISYRPSLHETDSHVHGGSAFRAIRSIGQSKIDIPINAINETSKNSSDHRRIPVIASMAPANEQIALKQDPTVSVGLRHVRSPGNQEPNLLESNPDRNSRPHRLQTKLDPPESTLQSSKLIPSHKGYEDRTGVQSDEGLSRLTSKQSIIPERKRNGSLETELSVRGFSPKRSQMSDNSKNVVDNDSSGRLRAFKRSSDDTRQEESPYNSSLYTSKSPFQSKSGGLTDKNASAFPYSALTFNHNMEQSHTLARELTNKNSRNPEPSEQNERTGRVENPAFASPDDASRETETNPSKQRASSRLRLVRSKSPALLRGAADLDSIPSKANEGSDKIKSGLYDIDYNPARSRNVEVSHVDQKNIQMILDKNERPSNTLSKPQQMSTPPLPKKFDDKVKAQVGPNQSDKVNDGTNGMTSKSSFVGKTNNLAISYGTAQRLSNRLTRAERFNAIKKSRDSRGKTNDDEGSDTSINDQQKVHPIFGYAAKRGDNSKETSDADIFQARKTSKIDVEEIPDSRSSHREFSSNSTDYQRFMKAHVTQGDSAIAVIPTGNSGPSQDQMMRTFEKNFAEEKAHTSTGNEKNSKIAAARSKSILNKSSIFRQEISHTDPLHLTNTAPNNHYMQAPLLTNDNIHASRKAPLKQQPVRDEDSGPEIDVDDWSDSMETAESNLAAISSVEERRLTRQRWMYDATKPAIAEPNELRDEYLEMHLDTHGELPSNKESIHSTNRIAGRDIPEPLVTRPKAEKDIFRRNTSHALRDFGNEFQPQNQATYQTADLLDEEGLLQDSSDFTYAAPLQAEKSRGIEVHNEVEPHKGTRLDATEDEDDIFDGLEEEPANLVPDRIPEQIITEPIHTRNIKNEYHSRSNSGQSLQHDRATTSDNPLDIVEPTPEENQKAIDVHQVETTAPAQEPSSMLQANSWKASRFRPNPDDTIEEELQEEDRNGGEVVHSSQEGRDNDDATGDNSIVAGEFDGLVLSQENSLPYQPPNHSIFMNYGCSLISTIKSRLANPCNTGVPVSSSQSFTQHVDSAFMSPERPPTHAGYILDAREAKPLFVDELTQSSGHGTSSGEELDDQGWLPLENNQAKSCLPQIADLDVIDQTLIKEDDQMQFAIRRLAQSQLQQHIHNALSLNNSNKGAQRRQSIADTIESEETRPIVLEQISFVDLVMRQTESFVPPDDMPVVGSVDNQGAIEKFIATLKNEGVEVLKLGRRNNWQIRYLTVSREVSWPSRDQSSDVPQCLQCPRALLWLKQFSVDNYSIDAIKSKGRGGLLFTQLMSVSQDITEAFNKKVLPRKHHGTFPQSGRVILSYVYEGGVRDLLICFKTDVDASSFCTSIRIIKKVVDRWMEAEITSETFTDGKVEEVDKPKL